MTIHSTILAAENTIETGNPILNIAIFVIFIVATMTIVVRATRQTSQKGSDFYTGGASFSGWQNGLAIAGDYLSAAAFLGVTGAIALYGYDGFLYSVGFLIALLVALVLVAEPLRNTGKFTMADVLSFRLKQRPVRTAAAMSTLIPDRADGRCGRLGCLVAGHLRQGRAGRCCRHRRCTHDHLRSGRRHEGHDLCADD